MLSVRRMLLLLCVMSVLVFVAACGGGNDDSSGGETPSPTTNETPAKENSDKETPKEEKQDPVTLNFIHWRGEDTTIIEGLLEDFYKEYPYIKVEMETYPSSEYSKILQTKLLDGKSGDMFAVLPGSHFSTVHKAGLLLDLTDQPFVKNYQENLIANGVVDGKQYGLAYMNIYNTPIYNKGIFEKLGLEIPDTWEGFLAMCEKLKQNGHIPIVIPNATIGPGQFMNTMMMNNIPDPEVVVRLQEGNAKATEDWWVKTLTQIKELEDKGYFQKNSLGTDQPASIALFAQGNAGILATGSFHMKSVNSANPDIEMGMIAPITVDDPAKIQFEGIHNSTFLLGINAKSPKQDAALKLLEFFSRTSTAEEYSNASGMGATVKGVKYTNPLLKGIQEWGDKKTTSQIRSLITNPQVEKALTGSIQAVVGGTSPEKAAEEAQKLIDQAIK